MSKKVIIILIVSFILFLLAAFFLSKTIREKYFSFCCGEDFPVLYQEGKHKFPYIAGKGRKELLESGYAQIRTGMNVNEVIKKMGNPDSYAFKFSTIFSCCKTGGISYVYYLNLKSEESLAGIVISGGKAVEKNEKYYSIFFDKDWNVVSRFEMSNGLVNWIK